MLHLINNDKTWLIEPESYARLCALPLLASVPGKAAAQPEPQVAIDRGLATVRLRGTLLREATEADHRAFTAYGVEYTETAEAAKALKRLGTDPGISVVLLDMDSPGGTVNGTPELANAVRDLARCRHVYAYTAGMCCSAAYWVASQCDGIYAAPSARLGSIGVLLPVTDSSEAYSRNGIRVEMFTAGRYKGTGMRGTSLTDEQRALLQEQVNATWQEFKAAVNSRRSVPDEAMEGQTFSGRQAVVNGLADGCADSLAAVQDKLRQRHLR